MPALRAYLLPLALLLMLAGAMRAPNLAAIMFFGSQGSNSTSLTSTPSNTSNSTLTLPVVMLNSSTLAGTISPSTISNPMPQNAVNAATINAKASSLVPDNTVIDSGQAVTYALSISGGTGPFTANLLYYGNRTVANTVLASGAGTVTFGTQYPSSPTSYIALIADDGTSPAFIFNSTSNSITVNRAPSAGPLIPNVSQILSGQAFTYNLIISGGTGPFIANLIYSGNGIVANTIVLPSQGTLTFGAQSPASTTSYQAEVTDEGTSYPFLFNSISNTLVVTGAPTPGLSTTGQYGGQQKNILNYSYTKHSASGRIDTANGNYILIYGSSFLHSISISSADSIAANLLIINQASPFANVAGPSAQAYQYFQINSSSLLANGNATDNTIDNYLSGVAYNFSVPISWVSALGISSGNIRLLRYNYPTSSWEAVPTSYSHSNSTSYFYEALSPSMSTYVVTYTTQNTVATGTSISMTMPVGYSQYFFGAGETAGSFSTGTGTSDNLVNFKYANPGGGSYYVVGLAHSSSSTGSMTFGSKSGQGSALAGIGANVLFSNGVLFRGNTTSGTSLPVSYTVAASNSFVILIFGEGGSTFSSAPSLPPECTRQTDATQSPKAEVEIAVCGSQASSTYTTTLSSSATAGMAFAAYVFPPYSVFFDDNTITGTSSAGTITTNGNTYASGQNAMIIGQNTITANPPSGYTFNSWWVSNILNLTVLGNTANPTTLIVRGNGTVNAIYQQTPVPVSTFAENGLPFTGEKWFVTYNGATSNAVVPNSITFAVSSGSHAFTVSNVVLGPTTFIPNPSSGSLTSGGTQTINFSPAALAPPALFVETGLPSGAVQWGVTYNGISAYEGMSNWVAANSYPIPIGSSGCTTSGTYIYCIGGDPTVEFATANVYYANTLSTNAITLWAPTNSYPSLVGGEQCSTNSISATIGCVGGLVGTGATPTSLSYYAPLINGGAGIGSWTASSSYPTQINEHQCAAYNNAEYCVGGEVGAVASSILTNSLYYSQLSSTGFSPWIAANTYPTNVEVEGCTAYSGYLYCVAGFNGIPTNAFINNAYAAQIASNGNTLAWTAANSYPHPVDQNSCVSASGYIYCVGGYTPPVVTNLTFMASLSGSSIGKWRGTTPYPENTNMRSCVVENKNVYCIGAVGSVASNILNNVYYSETSPANTITLLVTNPGNFLYTIPNTIINGITYVPSVPTGNMITGNTLDVAFGSIPNLTSVYNPVLFGQNDILTSNVYPSDGVNIIIDGSQVASGTGSVSYTENALSVGLHTVTSYDTADGYSNTLILDVERSIGTIYCLGGETNQYSGYIHSYFSNSVEYGTLSSSGIDSWHATTPYPFNISFHSCTSYNSTAYCIGGKIPDGTFLSSTYYAPISYSGVGQWATTNAYAFNVAGSACVSYSGAVYCIGGKDSSGLYYGTSEYANVLTTNTLGAWQPTTAYPINDAFQSCVTYGGTVYCIGGETTGNIPTNAVEYAPLSSAGIGSWVATNSYPLATDFFQCAQNNGYIYCAGGGGSTSPANVYYAQILPGGSVSSWVSTNAYPNQVAYEPCTALSGYVYCIGGQSTSKGGGGFLNETYYSRILPTNVLGSWSPTAVYPLNISIEQCPIQQFYSTSFSETGLPSGSSWNVIYNNGLQSSTSSTINFVTTFGNFLFSVASQVISLTTYFADPSGGTIQSGSLQNILFSVPIPFSSTPAGTFLLSNTQITDGQASVANAVVYGGSGGPYSGQWSFFQGNLLSTASVLASTISDGTNPYGVAFNPNGTLAYVTNHGSATVNVINVATNTVVNTINVGTNPSGVAFSPTGSFAYVAAAGSSAVDVINVATNSVASTISTTATPSAVAFSPNGTIAYVAHYTSPGTISKIYVPSNTVVNTIDVGAYPHGVAFNPSGSLAYSADYGGDVSVIDVATNTVVNTIPDGAHPYGVAFNPSGSLAYVVNEGSATANVIDVPTNTVIATITVGTTPYGVTFNPSGTLAFVTNYGSATVSEIEVDSNTIVKTISVGTNPYTPAFSPSGDRAYIAAYGGGVDVIGNLPETNLQNLPAVQTSNGLTQVTINAFASNELTFDFNGITYTESTGSSTIYGTWNIYSFAQDNGTDISYYGSNNLLLSNTLTVQASSFSTTFNETGLPYLGESWDATYGGTPGNSVVPNSISISSTSGSHSYSVSNVVIGRTVFVPNPSSGSISAGSIQQIIFSPISAAPATSFVENGLPSNSEWNVNYNGITVSSGVSNWVPTNGYPIAEDFASCAPYQGYIYCTGGDAIPSDRGVNSVYYSQILPSNVLSSWSAANDYPANIAGQQCSVSNGAIGCVGGLINYASTPTTYAYYAPILPSNGVGQWALSSNTYYTHINLHRCVTYSGYEYCVGGNAGVGTPPFDTNSVYYSELTTSGFSGLSGQWFSTNSYPTNIEVEGCASYNAYLYCTGGYNGIPVNQVTRGSYYAPILPTNAVGAWSATNSYPLNIMEQQCTSYDGYIYCIGGSTGAVGQNSVYLAPVSNSGIGKWLLSTPFQNKILNQNCMAYGGNIYCIAGNPASGGIFSDNSTYAQISSLNTVVVFDSENGNFVYTVPNQIINGQLYAPIPSTENAITGNTVNINFYAVPNISIEYNPILYGQNDLITANTVPSDTVNLLIDGTLVASGTGSASYTENALSVGTHAITANDISDGISAAATLTVTRLIDSYYCIGGDSNPSGTAFPSNIAAFGTLSDTGLDQWHSTSQYPLNISYHSCASYNGTVYCAGGKLNDSTFVNSIYYAPITYSGIGTWQPSSTPYPYNAAGEECMTNNSNIYCIGGKDSSGIYYNSIYYSSISSAGIASWNTASNDYPQNTAFSSCLPYNGIIYCIAGEETGNVASNSVYYSSILASNDIGQWSLSANAYPVNTYLSSCTAYNGIIYCVGGISTTANDVYYSSILPNGNLGQWITANAYPSAVSATQCTAYGGYIYCTGGDISASNSWNATYYAQILPTNAIGSWQSTSPYPTKLSISSCVPQEFTSTSFNEAGLPSGTTWNALYGNVLEKSSSDTINFVNAVAGKIASFAFSIATQIVSGNIYTPSPSSGTLEQGTSNAITFTSLSAACTINLPSNQINFGTGFYPATSTSPLNSITDNNLGSAAAYIYLSAGNWIGPTENFYAPNTLWGASIGQISGTVPFYNAPGSPTNTALLVPGTSGNFVYFGLNVPIAQPSELYTQNLIITNVC